MQETIESTAGPEDLAFDGDTVVVCQRCRHCGQRIEPGEPSYNDEFSGDENARTHKRCADQHWEQFSKGR